MATLESLFPDADRVDPHENALAESKLTDLVGGVVGPSNVTDHVAERQRLHELVGGRAHTTAPTDARAAAALPRALSRRTKDGSRCLRRQRRDSFAIVMAGLAVLAIAGAGLVGVRAAVAATPTDGAALC